MNNYFDEKLVEQYYPEAGELMLPSMLIWKLPLEKKDMLSDICSQGEYFLQEKIDGAFYQFVKTEHHEYLFGRTVSRVTGLLTEKSDNVPHIKNALSFLPAGTILIGEIYVPGGTAKDTVHIMGCLPQEAIKRQEKEGFIKYYVHDIIAYDGVNLINCGAEERYNILAAVWNQLALDKYDFLRLAVKVDAEQEEEISRILKSGGEGVVMKKRNAPYSPGKRPAWSTLKVKQMDSIDLVCIGLCPPTKEYTGKELETWPYWVNNAGDINNSNVEQISLSCMYGVEGWTPVTKYYCYNWPSAIQIGAYDQDGNLKLLGTVSSGLSDTDKQNMGEHPDDYIGRVVSLDCMSIDTKEKTLRHPVFKSWRSDKDAKDCLINEVFQ